jgi:hypothetical protein
MVILGYKLNLINLFSRESKRKEFDNLTFTFPDLTFGVSGKLHYNKSEL